MNWRRLRLRNRHGAIECRNGRLWCGRDSEPGTLTAEQMWEEHWRHERVEELFKAQRRG